MKRWLNPEREARILELYERYENAREVAAELGICDETVYRALKKHDIKRTHRHDKESDDTSSPHCKSKKYCPALIVMLNRCMGYKAKAIADVTGYEKNGVQNVLSKRGLTAQVKRAKKSDFDLEQIEYEFLVLKISGRQLDKKYGLSEGTICKWMRQRGHYSGKGAHQEGRISKSRAAGDFVYTDRMRKLNQQRHDKATLRFSESLQERFDGRFKLAGEYRPEGKHLAYVRCTECGHEFMHSIDIRKSWECPSCKEIHNARKNLIASLNRFSQNKARTRNAVDKAIGTYQSASKSLRLFLVDKKCVVCGTTFHSSIPQQICCSPECSRKKNGGDTHRRRARRYRVAFDKTISLHALYKRDKGVCQICGEPCDWNDNIYGSCGPTYPSIDHIIPFARGGEHTWDNVQLAHCMCNSIKGVTQIEVKKDVKLAC